MKINKMNNKNRHNRLRLNEGNRISIRMIAFVGNSMLFLALNNFSNNIFKDPRFIKEILVNVGIINSILWFFSNMSSYIEMTYHRAKEYDDNCYCCLNCFDLHLVSNLTLPGLLTYFWIMILKELEGSNLWNDNVWIIYVGIAVICIIIIIFQWCNNKNDFCCQRSNRMYQDKKNDSPSEISI